MYYVIVLLLSVATTLLWGEMRPSVSGNNTVTVSSASGNTSDDNQSIVTTLFSELEEGNRRKGSMDNAQQVVGITKDTNTDGESECQKVRTVREVKMNLTATDLLENIGQLAIDLLDVLGLRFLTFYIPDNITDMRMLKWMPQKAGVLWRVAHCLSPVPPQLTSSSFNYHPPALIITLCEPHSTVSTLMEAERRQLLQGQVWVIAGLPESLSTLSPTINIPLDSMVAEITPTSNDVMTFYELWSPGPDVHLRRKYAATWRKTPDRAEERVTFSDLPKYDRRRDLTGVHFVITTVNDSLGRAHISSYDRAQKRDVLSGFFGNVWELLRAEMNFTYSVVTPEDGEFGSANADGSWTGLIGEMLSGRADVVVAYLSQTYSRSQVLDYSSVLIKFSYRIFARPPELSAVSWTSYTRPFSTVLWLGLIIFLLIMSIVFSGISHWYWVMASNSPAPDRNPQRFLQWKKDSTFLIWAAVTQQGWPVTPEVGTLRSLFWALYMMGLVVLASYSATLVSFLTVTGNDLDFDSLAELKQLHRYRLGIQKGSVLEEFFKNQNFLEYWDSLIAPYSDTLLKTYSELLAKSRADPNYAFVGTYEIQRQNRENACTFKTARHQLFYNDGALGWPKGSPYVELFDYFIGKLRESGILKKVMNVWYPTPHPCPDQTTVPMGFQQVFTAFVMLGIGTGLSLLFLGLEKITNRFTKTIQNTQGHFRGGSHIFSAIITKSDQQKGTKKSDSSGLDESTITNVTSATHRSHPDWFLQKQISKSSEE